MKKLMTLILAAGLFVAGTAPASAIEFKAQGEWLMGFGVGDGNLVNKDWIKAGEFDKITVLARKFVANTK